MAVMAALRLSALALLCAATGASDKDIKNYAALENPFRMQKINLVWDKARLKLELAEGKLSQLYSQLKLQDKEELTLKKLKAEGGDKSGAKETDVRRKFSSILKTFGLGGAWEGAADTDTGDQDTKTIFKDKKLQKLWEKAEKSGLTPAELLVLQEEFSHHQEKVDEYHELLEMVESRDTDRFNTIQRELEKDVFDIRDTNELKKKAKGIKQEYDRLHRLATNQGDYSGFKEPKIAGLWKLALEAQFDAEELESLREELSHYEKRLDKLRFLESELQQVDERRNRQLVREEEEEEEKTEGRKIMDRKLSKHIEAVKKLHESIETKIMARHNEL